MKSMPLQERIIFLFFQPIRRAWTFLVASAHITRHWSSSRLGFCAFEGNNFLRHKLVFAVVGLGFFFLTFGSFFFGQTEQ